MKKTKGGKKGGKKPCQGVFKLAKIKWETKKYPAWIKIIRKINWSKRK